MKQISEYPSYSITKDGRIYSQYKKGWLRPLLNNYGYFQVDLHRDGHRRNLRVHRLVLETFVGPCPLGMGCRHLDGNKTNNKLANLCWGTQAQNCRDAIEHGTKNTQGEQNPQHKLTTRDVRLIIYVYRTKLFSQQEIAKMYGIDHTTISNIIRRKNWKHVWANR